MHVCRTVCTKERKLDEQNVNAASAGPLTKVQGRAEFAARRDGEPKVPGKGSQRPGFRSRIAARGAVCVPGRCRADRMAVRAAMFRSSTACSWRRVLRTQWLQAWSQSPGPAAMALSASYALADFSVTASPRAFRKGDLERAQASFRSSRPDRNCAPHVPRQLDGETALLMYCVIRPSAEIPAADL